MIVINASNRLHFCTRLQNEIIFELKILNNKYAFETQYTVINNTEVALFIIIKPDASDFTNKKSELIRRYGLLQVLPISIQF